MVYKSGDNPYTDQRYCAYKKILHSKSSCDLEMEELSHQTKMSFCLVPQIYQHKFGKDPPTDSVDMVHTFK